MSFQDRKGAYGCTGCCCFIGILLIIILVPMSLQRLEFYEAGLLARRSTGTLDRSKVWTSGLHQVGPDYHFKVFPINLQEFSKRVSVWSKSGGGDAGTTLLLDVSFQYSLQAKNIVKLYEKAALNFKPLIEVNAMDAIKNTAPLFGSSDYLSRREDIEAMMLANVTKAISKDLFVDVADLQLRAIIMTPELQSTKLAAAVQAENNEKETFTQQKALILEQTSLDVLKIENEAKRTQNEATARAKEITERAKYLAKQTIETARSEGLKAMIAELGLTSDEHKASLDYITTLIQNKARVTPYVNMGSMSNQKKVA
jgi:hypothetical protein